MAEIEVSEIEFKKLPQSDQNWIVLQTFHTQTEKCNQRFCLCENEIDKINSRKWYSAGASAIGGFVGGIVAVIGKSLFIK